MTSRSRLLAPAFALAFLLSAPASIPSTTVTLDDVLALLKAGVGESIILKEIGAGGPSFDLGVQEVLRLKAAGAGDALIERLMAARSADSSAADSTANQEQERPPAYRIFRETTADGHEVLHVTNLDAQGRRMGADGPEAEEAPRPEPRVDREEFIGGGASAASPVVVNVYPPDSSAPEGYAAGNDSPYMYRDPYAYSYPSGILPGYRPAFGFFRPPGAFAPPGSANRVRRAHGEGGGRSCSRLGPNYAPIGSAIGFDTFYSHTRAGFRR